MTNEIRGGENITLTSLCNILRKSLHKQDQVVHLCQIRRSELVGQIEQYRIKDEYYDRYSLDSRREVLFIWDREIKWHKIFEEFCDYLDGNPLPGGRHRLLGVAYQWYPKISRWEWKEIFQHYGVNGNFLVYFPVQGDQFDIDALERQLHALAQEDGYIYASSVPALLGLSPNGKEYRNVKKELSCRGWEWKSRRSNGNLLKIITPPVNVGKIS